MKRTCSPAIASEICRRKPCSVRAPITDSPMHPSQPSRPHAFDDKPPTDEPHRLPTVPCAACTLRMHARRLGHSHAWLARLRRLISIFSVRLSRTAWGWVGGFCSSRTDSLKTYVGRDVGLVGGPIDPRDRSDVPPVNFWRALPWVGIQEHARTVTPFPCKCI